MKASVEKIFVDLILHDLDLPANYGIDSQGNEIPSVTIKNQNIKLFNTPKMQITVGTISNRVFSNRRSYEEKTVNDETVYNEVIDINEQRVMQIDVYSKNNEARERFFEVQACFNSTYAQQLQDKYQFRIGKMSNATNISGLDGSSDINRFTIRFNVLSWQTITKAVDYYNNFRTTAQTNNDELIADFTIIGEQ